MTVTGTHHQQVDKVQDNVTVVQSLSPVTWVLAQWFCEVHESHKIVGAYTPIWNSLILLELTVFNLA